MKTPNGYFSCKIEIIKTPIVMVCTGDIKEKKYEILDVVGALVDDRSERPKRDDAVGSCCTSKCRKVTINAAVGNNTKNNMKSLHQERPFNECR